MARQGRAGEALGISLIAGLVGGLFGLVVLVAATKPLAMVALAFTPPAYFALRHPRPLGGCGLSGGSLLKGCWQPRSAWRSPPRPRSDVRRAALHVRRARSLAASSRCS
jgi:hypothetical protein